MVKTGGKKKTRAPYEIKGTWEEMTLPYAPEDPTEKRALNAFLKKHKGCRQGIAVLTSGMSGIGKSTIVLCWGCKMLEDVTNVGTW